MNREQFIEQTMEFLDGFLERRDGVTDDEVRETAARIADKAEHDGIPFDSAMGMVLFAVLTM